MDTKIYEPKLVRTEEELTLFDDERWITGAEMMHQLGLKHKNALYYALRYGIKMQFIRGRKMYSSLDTQKAIFYRDRIRIKKAQA